MTDFIDEKGWLCTQYESITEAIELVKKIPYDFLVELYADYIYTECIPVGEDILSGNLELGDCEKITPSNKDSIIS